MVWFALQRPELVLGCRFCADFDASTEYRIQSLLRVGGDRPAKKRGAARNPTAGGQVPGEKHVASANCSLPRKHRKGLPGAGYWMPAERPRFRLEQSSH